MIPERYQNATWKDVPPNIQKAVKEMCEGGKGIYLYGGVGVGKTHIAYAIKQKLEEKQIPVRFWNVTELLRVARNDYSKEKQDKRQPDVELTSLNAHGEKPVAILDDVGAEKSSEFVTETLYSIINERYNKVMPTILTSNLDLAQLAEKVGERTASRLAEMCKVINLTGNDRRVK